MKSTGRFTHTLVLIALLTCGLIIAPALALGGHRGKSPALQAPAAPAPSSETPSTAPSSEAAASTAPSSQAPSPETSSSSGPSPEAAQSAMVPFSAFTPPVEIQFGPMANDDEFELEGAFVLGAGSDGISPPTEAVSLQIGTYSMTIPAGSFQQAGQGSYMYMTGNTLEVEITQLPGGVFEFQMEGQGLELTGTVNPVPVTLMIGNDGGSAIVAALFE